MQFRPLRSGLFLTAALSLTACNGALEIPVELESPDYDINITEQVEGFEDSLCDDLATADCRAIIALDKTDDGMVSDPPRIPDEFPVEVPIEECDDTTGACVTGDPLNADTWFSESGMSEEAANLAQIIPVDMAEEAAAAFDEAGIDLGLIDGVNIDRIAINWKENSLTFDTLPIDFYITQDIIDADADANALIADGTLTKVGTLGAQSAGADGEQDLTFVDGGAEALSAALTNLSFTAVVTLGEGAEIALPEGSSPDMRAKPQGLAKVSLKVKVTYTATADAVLGLF